MALGFRKSLFGYNCEEVLEHISKITADNKQTVLTLKDKIKSREEENLKLLSEAEDLNKKLLEINESLEFYKSKYEEIKNLSDNIGKLYLVAQTNAKAIVSAADAAHISSKTEIDRNISVLEEAEAALNGAKQKLNDLNREFSSQVTVLSQELEEIRELALTADTAKNENVQSFEQAFKSITE